MKSLNMFIYVGISLLILSVVVVTGLIPASVTTVLGHSISGLFFTLGFFLDDLVVSRNNNRKKIGWLSNLFYFLGVFSLVFSPYLSDLEIIQRYIAKGDMDILSNYVTMVSLSVVILGVGLKDFLEKSNNNIQEDASQDQTINQNI